MRGSELTGQHHLFCETLDFPPIQKRRKQEEKWEKQEKKRSQGWGVPPKEEKDLHPPLLWGSAERNSLSHVVLHKCQCVTMFTELLTAPVNSVQKYRRSKIDL